MADFDVGALSLQVPPTSAVIQAYRPAVLVRNYGVHDALASGSLRIYSPAGLCIFTSEIYSGTIAPGETKPAQSVDYWTPPALGRYQLIAYVSCTNDQVESNNSLPPCFVTVGPGAPEEPTTVPIHASQHEEGGPDELNLDGLHGRATDAQTPLGHRATHEATGSDALDVTGLTGVLAQGQPLADHATTHEALGGDRINVDGLHGELYNLQKPKTHANEAHDPNYATTPHGNSAHDPDFCPLDDNNLVDPDYLGTGPLASGNFLHSDQTWKPVVTQLSDSIATAAQIPQGSSATILDFDEPLTAGAVYDLELTAHLVSTTLSNILTLTVLAGNAAGDLTAVATATIPIAAGASNRFAHMHFAAQLLTAWYLAVQATETDNMDLAERSKMPTLNEKLLATHFHIRLTAGLTQALSSTDALVMLCALSKRTP